MNCPTEEQLAGMALGVFTDAAASAHIEHCEACRAKLAELSSLTRNLSAAHAAVDHNHAASRAALLSRLEGIERLGRANPIRHRIRSWLGNSSLRQRIAAAGIGVSTVAGMALLIAFLVSWATPLSAMERMVKQLRLVTSFSFELEETSDRITGANRRRIQRNDTNFWRAPASWHGTTRIVKLSLPPQPGEAGELLVNVEEIYTTGQRGILIDHKAKTYFRTPEMLPDSFPDYSPIKWVQRMSKGSVEAIADLGKKQLRGKTVHGYVVSFGHPDPDSGQNAIHVWLDPETNLPVEFQYEERHENTDGAKETEVWTNVMCVTNCQWNIELNPELFAVIPPADYSNTSWPNDANSIEEMTQALRLYAQLSGGHYPRVDNFRSDGIQREMFEMVLPDQHRPQSVCIEPQLIDNVKQAKAGLNWIEQTLRNKHHTGYYGTDVGPDDKEKILMWWPVDVEDAYQVIYGDLRTAVLPLAEWAKLVPADVAKSHTPLEYSKPAE